jgi:hypothetical protein
MSITKASMENRLVGLQKNTMVIKRFLTASLLTSGKHICDTEKRIYHTLNHVLPN